MVVVHNHFDEENGSTVRTKREGQHISNYFTLLERLNQYNVVYWFMVFNFVKNDIISDLLTVGALS